MDGVPSWAPGICAWARDNDHDGPHYCAGWNTVCEPKACKRKRHAAQRRAKELSAHRQFPGNPFQVETKRKAMELREKGVENYWTAALPRGHCRWCGGPILKPNGELNLRRTWHSGRGEEVDCLLRYYLHTRAENQLAFLVERDGIGCRQCGAAVGGWSYRRLWVTNEFGLGFYQDRQAHVEDGPDGPMCRTWWVSGLQVDHVIALAVVALQVSPEKRWRFFGPTNLQCLCQACHSRKTTADVALLKAVRLTLLHQAPAQPS